MGRPEINFADASTRVNELNRFIFLLTPGFSALDLGAGIDSLGAANAASEQAIFEWNIVSETGEAVTSSSGMTVAVDGGLIKTRRGDCIVICGPMTVDRSISNELKSWLRQGRRFGVQLCGIGGGSGILAMAGVASGQSLSAHWKQQPVMVELFPTVESNCSVFVDEGPIATCGGGVTTLDLFSSLIGQACGQTVASRVADQLLYASVRPKDGRQTQTDLFRFGRRHEKLATAIMIMRENLENQLSPSVVAESAGLSTRQLERLFQRYVGTSPKNYMTRLRLERARTLLQQTDMRVLDVAIACGFGSASYFSKCFRRYFGTSPHMQQKSV